LSYVPSPPDRRVWPWKLLSEPEVEDVKRRLYGPGGLVAQRMATGGYSPSTLSEDEGDYGSPSGRF
jgi:hypothetical protein